MFFAVFYRIQEDGGEVAQNSQRFALICWEAPSLFALEKRRRGSFYKIFILSYSLLRWGLLNFYKLLYSMIIEIRRLFFFSIGWFFFFLSC